MEGIGFGLTVVVLGLIFTGLQGMEYYQAPLIRFMVGLLYDDGAHGGGGGMF